MRSMQTNSIPYACLAGLALYFIAMGSCRYCYPPALPLMVSEHWATLSQAGYLGSANFLGFLLGVIGCVIAARYVKRSQLVLVIIMVAVITNLLTAWNLGFLWLLIWRFVNGLCGGALMVLAPSLIFASVPEKR